MTSRLMHRNAISVLGLGLCLSTLVGCAKRPYYSGFYFDSPPLVEADRSHMVRHLDAVLERQKFKKITMVTPDKGAQSLYPRDETSPGTTDWIPLPLLYTAYFVLDSKYRGLEIDLLAKTEADGFTPVSAVYDLDGSVRLEMGTPLRELTPSQEDLPSKEALCVRYHLGSIDDGDRSWQPLELHALAQALSLLHPDELAVLKGVRFVRSAHSTETSKRGSKHKIRATYFGTVKGDVAGKDAREIHLFDAQAASDSALFIGEPSHPLPIPAMVLLHEMGHAIADYVRIDAYRTYNQLTDSYNLQVDKWNAGLHDSSVTESARAEQSEQFELSKKRMNESKEYLAMVKQQYQRDLGPVLTAFQRVRGPEKGPTDYGQTDLEESFAESFALAKADPQALRRIYPALADWFAGQEHLGPLRSVLRHSP
jgi:hypothetical protein